VIKIGMVSIEFSSIKIARLFWWGKEITFNKNLAFDFNAFIDGIDFFDFECCLRFSNGIADLISLFDVIHLSLDTSKFLLFSRYHPFYFELIDSDGKFVLMWKFLSISNFGLKVSLGGDEYFPTQRVVNCIESV
jgi:hypothetical protein